MSKPSVSRCAASLCRISLDSARHHQSHLRKHKLGTVAIRHEGKSRRVAPCQRLTSIFADTVRRFVLPSATAFGDYKNNKDASLAFKQMVCLELGQVSVPSCPLGAALSRDCFCVQHKDAHVSLCVCGDTASDNEDFVILPVRSRSL